jgi:hypothetical protein
MDWVKVRGLASLELRPWCGGRSQPGSAVVGLSALLNSVENLFQAAAAAKSTTGIAVR